MLLSTLFLPCNCLYWLSFFLTYYSTSLIIPLRFQDISLFLDVSFFRSKSFFYSFFWSALISCLYRTVSGDPLDQVFIYLLGNPSNNNKHTNKQTSDRRLQSACWRCPWSAVASWRWTAGQPAWWCQVWWRRPWESGGFPRQMQGRHYAKTV